MHAVFELGEDLLDRVEIGAVWGQQEYSRASGADQTADNGALVRPEIVENDDVARLERRDEPLFDVGGEALAVAMKVIVSSARD